MFEKLKDFKEYLPLTVALIAVVAFLEKYLFFQYFNIPIYNYLEVDEYFTLSIEIFVPFIILVLLGFGLIMVTTNFAMKFKPIKEKNLSYEIIKDKIFYCALLPAIYIVFATNQKLSFLSFLYIGFLIANEWENLIIKNDKTNKIFMWILFIFIGGILANSGGRVREIILGIKQDKTMLILKNKEIIELGKNLLKIDETKKYVFIYNNEIKTTRILERESIAEIYYNTENKELQKLKKLKKVKNLQKSK